MKRTVVSIITCLTIVGLGTQPLSAEMRKITKTSAPGAQAHKVTGKGLAKITAPTRAARQGSVGLAAAKTARPKPRPKAKAPSGGIAAAGGAGLGGAIGMAIIQGIGFAVGSELFYAAKDGVTGQSSAQDAEEPIDYHSPNRGTIGPDEYYRSRE